jgi:hypothetical protein
MLSTLQSTRESTSQWKRKQLPDVSRNVSSCVSPDNTSRKQLRVADTPQAHPRLFHTKPPRHHFISLPRLTRQAQDAYSERDNRDTFTRCREGHNEAHTRVLVGVRGGETCYKCTYTPVCLVIGPRRGSRGVEAHEWAMAEWAMPGLGVHKAGKDTRYERERLR